MYTVYIHKNKINGKVYIGITGEKPETRWNNGRNYANNNYFTNSINKNGWNNFEHIIYKTGLTKEKAEQIEIDLIKKYDATNQSKGYNIQHGGNSIGKHNEATKKLISKIQCKPVYQYNRDTGIFIAKFNSTIEAESKLDIANSHISAVCLNKMKTAGGFVFKYANDKDLKYGQPLSKEELDIINTNECKVAVVQYDLNGNYINEYKSIAQAKEQTGLLYANISANLMNKRKTSGGFIWKRKSEVGNSKDNLLIDEVSTAKNNKHKGVIQYTLDGVYISKYSTLSEASRQTDTQVLSISRNCRLLQHTANGYLWKYIDDVDNIRNLTKEEVDEYKKFNYKIPLAENKKIKAVIQYSLDGKYLATYNTQADAAKIIGGAGTHISSNCKMKRRSAGGYIWKYAIDVEPMRDLTEKEITAHNDFFKKKDKRCQKINKYSTDGKYIKTFSSLSDAAKDCNGSPTVLARCCKGIIEKYKGFVWKYT